MSYNTFKNITFQQMENLISLVEAGSFTRAAANIHLSQSSLTKQIQNMEEAAETKLVLRGSRGISLTPEGQVLYDYAKRMTRLRDEASARLERLMNQEPSHIYVVASTTPATYILPQLLRPLQQRYPAIKVHIQMRDSEEALQAVLDNQAEIGFIGKEVANKMISAERLCQDRPVLIVQPAHRFAGQKNLKLVDILKEPLIMREHGSGTRAIFEDCLQEHGAYKLSDFKIVCELGSTEAVKEAILAGLGISVLSAFAIRREIEHRLLVAVKIIDCPMERYFHIIYKKNFALQKQHRYFLDVIRKLSSGLTAL